MPTWEVQGAHRYYVDGDTLFWESHGEITLADLTAIFAVLRRIVQTHGYTLSSYDASGGVTMGPAARRASSEMSRDHSLRGATVIIGAGVTMRTVMLLLHNAARLFGRPQQPLHYCSTQEEALKWLELQRQNFNAAARDKQ